MYSNKYDKNNARLLFLLWYNTIHHCDSIYCKTRRVLCISFAIIIYLHFIYLYIIHIYYIIYILYIFHLYFMIIILCSTSLRPLEYCIFVAVWGCFASPMIVLMSFSFSFSANNSFFRKKSNIEVYCNNCILFIS